MCSHIILCSSLHTLSWKCIFFFNCSITYYFFNSAETLHQLDHCKPSSVTYISFLKLLRNLVEADDSRDYMAERVFGLSHSFGLDTDAVKSQLRKTCTNSVAKRILASCVDIVKDGAGMESNLYDLN